MRVRVWIVNFLQKYLYLFVLVSIFLLIVASCSLRSRNESTRLIPPDLVFKKSFRLLKDYRINACMIESNLYAPISGLMCHLNDPKTFVGEDLNVNMEKLPPRICNSNRVYGFMNYSDDEAQINDWLHLVVTREPLDRFLHAYVSRCINFGKHKRPGYACNECHADIACFIYREYNRMLAYSRGRYSTISVEDRAFFPQNWRCDFKNHLNKYKILRHYNINETDHSVWNEIFDILQERGVNIQNLNFLKSQVFSAFAEADGFLEVKQKLLSRVRDDPNLIRMLYRMYFYDFVKFGYNLPDID